MRINGVWVGWGLGDNSATDMTVKNFKAFARRMYKSYMGHLADTNLFDQQFYDALVIMQDKLVAGGQLHVGQFIRGGLDLPTQVATTFKKLPNSKPKRPITFSVEGHLSDMWNGPCATIAKILEEQAVCWWQPVGYDCSSLPFNNADGVNQLLQLVGAQAMPNGRLFPAGTPWGIEGFSQGAMVVSEFMAKHVLPANGTLHWRLNDFKRGLALGNPRREYGKVAPWADNPPSADTQGIMGDKTGAGTFITSGTAIASRWAENANDNDLFAENTRTDAGMDKTAIAKIITENSWIGGPASIFARVIALFGSPVGEGFAAIKAIFDAIMFLASNPNPHYTTYAEPGDIEWMRGVAS